MNKLLLLVTIYLLTGCVQQPTEDRDCFVNEIVRALGKDGKACSDRDGRTYCISANQQSPKPITVGDSLDPGQDLWICAEINGHLTGCKPSTSFSIHCNGQPGAGGGCRCTGLDSCLKMADKKGCNGSCGNCTGGQCCCEY